MSASTSPIRFLGFHMLSLYHLHLQDNPVYLASFLYWRIHSFFQTLADHFQVALLIKSLSTGQLFFCLLLSQNLIFFTKDYS